MKSRDEKGSDGGEGNSPAFREHGDHRNPFNDGSEDLEERGPSAAQPHAPDVVGSLEEVVSDVKKLKMDEKGKNWSSNSEVWLIQVIRTMALGQMLFKCKRA